MPSVGWVVRQLDPKEKKDKTIATIKWLDLIDISGQCIQKKKKKQNIHSFQMHMEHSLGLTTYWGTKLTSTNSRE